MWRLGCHMIHVEWKCLREKKKKKENAYLHLLSGI
jgi:hypothetical protein